VDERWLGVEGNVTGPPLTIQLRHSSPSLERRKMLYYVYNPYSGSCPPPGGAVELIPRSPVLADLDVDGHSFTKDHPKNAPKSSLVVVLDARLGRVVAVVGLQAWLWDGATWVARSGPSTDFGDFRAAMTPPWVTSSCSVLLFAVHCRSVTWAGTGSSCRRPWLERELIARL